MFPKIVFFGTPSFAAEILESLIQAHVPVLAVVTQPDRPRGRLLQVGPSAVKSVALKLIPDALILQPEKGSNSTFLSALKEIQADLYVVVAFGQILPQSLLNIPPLGCINIHASLLPKYRGAAPIQRALMNGDKETGVAIQKMVKQLDAGDVIASAKLTVSDEMNCSSLTEALCKLSKPLLLSVLKGFAKGIPPATPQDPDSVTFAPKITPEEGEIHWIKGAQELHDLIRAVSPKPGAWCTVQVNQEKKRLKILKTKVVHQKGKPGTLLSSKQELIVACETDALQLLEVQPEGKQKMLAADWLRGLKSLPIFY